MVDRIAGEQSKVPPASAAPPISETMTVNHILRVHPRAREVFQGFHIDCELDGFHCLDELYWRRGVDVAALLQALNPSTTEQESAG